MVDLESIKGCGSEILVEEEVQEKKIMYDKFKVYLITKRACETFTGK